MDKDQEMDPRVAMVNARYLMRYAGAAAEGSEEAATKLTDLLNTLTHRQTGALALALATIAATTQQQLVALAANASAKA